MNRIFFTVFVFIVSTYVCICQEGRFVPPEVPEKYCKMLNSAVLAADAGHTEESIPKIQELIEKYPTWTEPRHHLSRLLYDIGRKKEAIETLEASIAIDTASQLQQLYTLARLYEESGMFDKALPVYQTVINKAAGNPKLLEKVTTHFQKLQRKMEMFKTDYSITLTPLPDGINSEEHEALGRWSVDGRSLIFTRFINEQEDMFNAEFDESGALRSVSEMPFNSEFHEGGHTLSPDGKYLIFTSCLRPDALGDCDLYLAVKANDTWLEPINMGPGFNSPSWDGRPAFGLDGLSIYFASKRPGGYGGTDIWMTKELSLGKWIEPVNVGPVINTANNESSPFIHFDGRTMYFMRDGEEGLGGYDLYLARQGINGEWQTVENMGMPINSGADEGAISLHPDGKRAIITRLTEDRKNDLFEFELPDLLQSTPVQSLQVNVKDASTKLPIRARLEIFNVNNGDTVRISQWSDDKGNITVTLDRNKSYGIITSADGYVMHSSNLHADTSATRKLNIEMIALAKATDKPIALQNIYFETGSAKLLPSSNPELNKLVWTLRNNKNMHMEIRGHTDDVGTEEFNLQLSSDRAKAVYQYLIDRGIDASRLSYKGFGETQPVASNETEDGKQQNRRTEFVIRRFD